MSKPLSLTEAGLLARLAMERTAILSAMDTQMQRQYKQPLIMVALDIELHRVETAINSIIEAHS